MRARPSAWLGSVMSGRASSASSFPEPHVEEAPDTFDAFSAEAEREQLREMESKRTDDFLRRVASEMRRDTFHAGMSSFEIEEVLRTWLVKVWNQSRSVAAHHDAIGVAKPQI